MATTTAERLLDRVRQELGDQEVPFDFEFAADGIRDHYNIEHRPINAGTVVMIHNGEVLVDPAYGGITIDYHNGYVIFPSPPEAGDIYEVQGTKYRYFNDQELQVFLDTSLAQHSHNRGDTSGGDWTVGDLKPVEEYPIAIHATIQALWVLATDASFDIDIYAPDGVNIPRSQRYRQLLEMIGSRQHQYDELAHALNVGVTAIEVHTVRRTAKLTNRLVPVYLPSEYDDGSRPKRVYYAPMLQGTAPVSTNIGTYDHNIVSGDPYGVTLDFSFDLTDCEIKNEIRRVLPQSRTGTVGPAVQTFTQTVTDAPGGKVRLSLTGSQTRSLPYNAYWEIQVKKPGEDESRTYLRGMVLATNNEIVR